MKKLVLVAFVFALTPFVTLAQAKKAAPAAKVEAKTATMQHMDMSMGGPTSKGKWLVGPSLGFASSSEDDGNNTVKTSTMSIQPELGYFIADDLSIGLSLAFGAEQIRVDGTASDKQSWMFVAPTLRYYLPIASKFHFLGKLQVPIGSYKTTLDAGVDVDEKTTGFGVQAIPAFAFFPSNKIAIELSFGSLYFSSTKFGGTTQNDFGLAVLSDNDFRFSNGAPTLGVKWHFGK